uniref:Reverse transcriptase domain-containing protein n=1 Tax=Amphimedon queenslandica TaxID=400682 RepID=A0A1X7U4B2_AMPQE
MSSLLAPRQLGYGIPGGLEAAVHAARYFLRNMDDSSAFLKLDFRNAFNSIHRSKMLAAVSDLFSIGNCLRSFTAHDSIILLRYSFAICRSALSHWSDSLTPPVGDDARLQRVSDLPHIKSTLDSLLETDHAPTKARLYAVSTPESGAWLNALPLSAMGLRMDAATIQIAVGLRLGLPLDCPHSCHHCGSAVDDLATHGLHCKQSNDRLHRHSSINDILRHAFTAAGIRSRLEPSGLIGAEGRRPDGVTLVPWEVGKYMCWDFTCPDTLALSYVVIAATAGGSAAALTEEHKITKYFHFSPSYLFTPLSIETMGAVGLKSRHFVKELGKRIMLHSGDPHSYNYLMQRISVAIQKSNMVSVLGSLGKNSSDFID